MLACCRRKRRRAHGGARYGRPVGGNGSLAICQNAEKTAHSPPPPPPHTHTLTPHLGSTGRHHGPRYSQRGSGHGHRTGDRGLGNRKRGSRHHRDGAGRVNPATLPTAPRPGRGPPGPICGAAPTAGCRSLCGRASGGARATGCTCVRGRHACPDAGANWRKWGCFGRVGRRWGYQGRYLTPWQSAKGRPGSAIANTCCAQSLDGAASVVTP